MNEKARKSKILFVISTANLSGAERQLFELATHIDKNEFEPNVCCLEGEGSFTEAVRKAGVPVRVIPRKKSFDIIRLVRLIKTIHVNQYDIIQSFCWSANNYCRFASFFVKIPVLVSGERGRTFDNINIEHKIDQILSKRSTKIICNSESQKTKLLKSERVDHSKVCVIQNGIDLRVFSKAKPANLTRSFGIPWKNRVVCTINNFSEHKNPMMFLKMAKKVASQCPRVTFLYIGSGPDEDQYHDWVCQNRMRKRIIFTGYQKSIPSILKACHVFVLTSIWEGMPNVILEAMAAGVPVVSSDVDGCREIITDNTTGFLQDYSDLGGFVKRVISLLKSRSLSGAISSRALKKVRADFDVMKMVNRYECLYRELGSGKRND